MLSITQYIHCKRTVFALFYEYWPSNAIKSNLLHCLLHVNFITQPRIKGQSYLPTTPKPHLTSFSIQYSGTVVTAGLPCFGRIESPLLSHYSYLGIMQENRLGVSNSACNCESSRYNDQNWRICFLSDLREMDDREILLKCFHVWKRR